MIAKFRTAALTLLTVGLIAMGVLAVPVSAAPSWHQLYNTGDPATAAFCFAVYSPNSVGLDADYLNMTVKVSPIVSGTGTNATYYVLVYLNDGTTNYTLGNKSLAAKNDLTVYNNLSMADPGTVFVANSSALLTIIVKTSGYVLADSESNAFGIYSTEINEAIYTMIPAIVTIMVVAAIFPMISKMNKNKG